VVDDDRSSAAIAQIVERVVLAQAYVRHHRDIFPTHTAQFMTVRMYRLTT